MLNKTIYELDRNAKMIRTRFDEERTTWQTVKSFFRETAKTFDGMKMDDDGEYGLKLTWYDHTYEWRWDFEIKPNGKSRIVSSELLPTTVVGQLERKGLAKVGFTQSFIELGDAQIPSHNKEGLLLAFYILLGHHNQSTIKQYPL